MYSFSLSSSSSSSSSSSFLFQLVTAVNAEQGRILKKKGKKNKSPKSQKSKKEPKSSKILVTESPSESPSSQPTDDPCASVSTQKDVLLDFLKVGLINGDTSKLTDWDSSTDPCDDSWDGITCEEGEVTQIQLSK
jgi:hypothetical protein